MALIHRISRLFKADFHAVLDQIEEPEALLKQAIRDMEDDIASTEQRVKLSTHDQETLSQRKVELEHSIAEYKVQLDLCFESDKDDLARNIIRKKLETERLLKHLNSKHAENEKHLGEQRKTLEQNSATLESLRQKAELFSQRIPAHATSRTGSDDATWAVGEMSIGDDEVEVAYLRERNLRTAS